MAKFGDKAVNGVDGGSKFSSLANLSDKEGDNKGRSDGDMNGAAGDNQGAKTMGTDLKGKKKVAEREDLMEGVELCASDSSLLQGMRVNSRIEAKRKNESKPSIVGQIKERALKELNQQLGSSAVKLKASWIGLGQVKHEQSIERCWAGNGLG